MSESSDHTVETTTPVAATEPFAERTVVAAESKPNRLYQSAAWVAIVAGTLFIVAVIFFTGFVLGKHSGGYGHLDRSSWEHGRMRQGGPGMMGPGMMGPGMMGPGMMGPGMMGPRDFDESGPGGRGPGPGNVGPGAPTLPVQPTQTTPNR